jgi:UDP-glucuronate 4-epimerase
MKVLITGIAGFIGYHLAMRLASEGHEVFGVDNFNDYYGVRLKSSRLVELRGKLVFCDNIDITNFRDIDSVIKSVSYCDAVVHLAAQPGVRCDKRKSYIDSNITGFSNVIESCVQNNIKKFYYASSSSVYAVPAYGLNENNTDVSPLSFYGFTKKLNEDIADFYSDMFDISCMGFRFFSVYGPYGRPDMAYYSFTHKLMNDEPITLYNNGKNKRDFTLVFDVVDCIYKALMSSVDNGIYNIGYGESRSVIELLDIIADEMNKKPKVVYSNESYNEPDVTLSNCNSAKNDFNYMPKYNLETGINIFCNWYKEYYGV